MYYLHIINAFQIIIDLCVPKSRQNFKTKPVPYWTKECEEAVKTRNRAEKKMRKTKDLNDCISYREMKAKTQKLIRQTQRNFWESYCGSLTNYSNLSSVWKMSKRMSGTNTSIKWHPNFD